MKKITAILLLILLLLTLGVPVSAEKDAEPGERLETEISGTGYKSFEFLTDGKDGTYKVSNGNAEITIESESEMTALYLMFDLEYGAYTVKNNKTGIITDAGAYGILHEFVQLDAPTNSVTVTFDSGEVHLSEIYAFDVVDYTLPDYVQIWQPPHEGKTDLMLLATHGDDDQLFFAGLLPYYAAERNLAVQVVYLTDHRNLTMQRTHEMLNGLWSVGVNAYPVFGDFADFRIDSLKGTYDYYERLGTPKEELQDFVVEQIRRFKPQVAVGHDINGEYGHGMHMVYSELLRNAVELTNDESYHPESAQKYGVHQMQKVYLHLYEENPIVMDYDQPLESFGGMTAFEVTKKYGYPCHKSQQYTWFTDWLNGSRNQNTKASQIKTHSPCKFGLYYTGVGEDVAKNDFFENMVSYEEQARIEAERLEAERLEAERLEAERKEQLEKELAEKERKAAEEKQRNEIITIVSVLGGALLLCLIVWIVRRFRG